MGSSRGKNGCVTFRGLILICSLLAGPPSYAGIFDDLKGLLSSSPSSGSPTTDEISRGLLEALRVGAEKTVAKASAAGGFLGNPQIRIPLPKNIRKAASALKSVGLGKQVDEFETTLNRGAEKASREALPIFIEAIKGLSFQDVERIWKGGNSAATEYLREKTSSALHAAFEPVVHAAAQEVGVTRSYQSLTENPLARAALAGSDFDLDPYVTNKALDGLFLLLAEEEKSIRTNPAARTTDLLKKVFGL